LGVGQTGSNAGNESYGVLGEVSIECMGSASLCWFSWRVHEALLLLACGQKIWNVQNF